MEKEKTIHQKAWEKVKGKPLSKVEAKEITNKHVFFLIELGKILKNPLEEADSALRKKTI